MRKMRFSHRTAWDREEPALARALRARRAAGLPVMDLTVSNPSRCGLGMDAPEAALRAVDVSRYDPQPFGMAPAREAVAGYYAERGAAVDPGQICLTASTSEAYSFLFRLLCDPGDEVLIASPSYPLFEYLAALDDVRLVPYPLFYDHGWQIEPGAVEARVGPGTRAIVLVHPNNPTGHFVSEGERAALEEVCARHGMALVVDEVFLDHPWSTPRRSFACGPHRALTFVLSGLSKIAALPQMKLSWLLAFGPESREALERLEVIAATFLSVSAPAQAAAPAWLAASGAVRERIEKRVGVNLQLLDALVAGTSVSRLSSEGGWYAVLRVPALEPDETWAVRLLQETGVLVHPGSVFGFPDRGWLVVSLLAETEAFRSGVQSLVQQADRSTSFVH